MSMRVSGQDDSIAAPSGARTALPAEMFVAIAEAIADGVYVCDAAGAPLLVNRAGGALFGLPPDEALMALLTPAHGALRAADGQTLAPEDYPMARTLRGEAQADADYVIRRADSGEDRLLRFSLAPLRDPAGAITGGVCVARDVTMLRRQERERDEFVSRTTHELKTPLTSATGLLQLARRRIARQQEDPLGLAPMLETAQKQVDRLAVLIDDLRMVSQLRSGRLQIHSVDLDLREVVEGAARGAQAATTRHVLRLEQPRDPLAVRGDAVRLAQILDALLGNAIKYSPNGGEIRVCSRREDGDVVVEIEDQGIGIPAQDRAMLFEPFQRASNANQAAVGIGAGLYISRALARLHGGDVRLLPTQPGGSVFRLSLPLANPESLTGPIDG